MKPDQIADAAVRGIGRACRMISRRGEVSYGSIAGLVDDGDALTWLPRGTAARFAHKVRLRDIVRLEVLGSAGVARGSTTPPGMVTK